MRVRGFEKVSFASEDVILPVRADKGSAGYDFYSLVNAHIHPQGTYIFDTGVKAYMQDDEVLMLYVRSSIGIKKWLRLKNGTGIVDASYYNNPTNEGNIMIVIQNTHAERGWTIQKGERIAQGLFMKYLVADEDVVLQETRIGGTGSSGN